MKETFLSLATLIKRPGITDLIAWLETTDFYSAPASTRFHGAWEGGLVEHSVGVTGNLQNITAKLGIVWSTPETPLITGLFHDICKVDTYSLNWKSTRDGNGAVTREAYYTIKEAFPLCDGVISSPVTNSTTRCSQIVRALEIATFSQNAEK